MKLAEYCDTSTSYIGEIEIGRRFPSMELIEKIAGILRIEPYHFFKNRAEAGNYPDMEICPRLPNSMKNHIKTHIKTQMELSLNAILDETLNQYER